MFPSLFFGLRSARVPVSLKEYLMLMEALDARAAGWSVEDFYYVSRAALVKDERYLDRFDRVFGQVFKGIEPPAGAAGEAVEARELPDEWLRKLAEKLLSDEEKRQIEAMGGWEKLMETLRQRLAEQKGRHEGGSKWIGTAGTSPFGAYGYNPEGVRIGQAESRNRSAVKVWDKREFKNLDDDVELGTRNIKVVLRRLRKFARTGALDELDLPGTVRSTAHNAGWLDLKLQAERHNAVKVLLFLDIGGSMDDHVRVCAELFSAVRTEFKHLEQFYFHNCLYESVWKDNRRRHTERIPTMEILHKYGKDYRVVVVGDAAMSPYEVLQPGGSVERWNEESGEVWLTRLAETFERIAWINPTPERAWGYTQSTTIIRRAMGDRMYPLTLAGLEAAMKALSR
ncbi:MAG TPA: VWA domain-containing protein [Alphaproteobacteria bacterium]|nr:VWA domain-containing protein [Alphaproteobacteria bacterium]